jgi:hypothetical protein
MGAWGTAIFSDDTASNCRHEFRPLIAEGVSTEEATDKLLREYAASLDDPDEGPPFWLGLAVTQWKCGLLLQRVKEKALDIINTGANLKRWSADAKRRAVLKKTRARWRPPKRGSPHCARHSMMSSLASIPRSCTMTAMPRRSKRSSASGTRQSSPEKAFA